DPRAVRAPGASVLRERAPVGRRRDRSGRHAARAGARPEREPERADPREPEVRRLPHVMDSVYVTPEHELLRDQVARFVAREVEPHALQWERDGCTPREVLRKLGAAGMLGLMFAPQYGGGGADALTNLVFAEALSQSTFGGFIVTVLVHTDMASPHLH